MHIFTYGTLMFPEVWQAVAGRAFDSVVGRLDGFAVCRVAGAVFPGIIAAEASSVPGVVYLDVDEAAVERLDRFEDDFYDRQTLSIDCVDGNQRTADAYVVPAERRQVLTNEPWTRESFIASGGLEQFVRRFAGFARVAEEEER
jgi:gamma-glutamylcyclotransferase (GGCT)/AIG2-like uncharacterized protein YtfP